MADKKMSHALRKMFVDADTNKDGLVSRAEFTAMMNKFLATPKKFYLPCPAEGQYDALFQKYVLRKNGTMTVNEWMALATQEVLKKFN